MFKRVLVATLLVGLMAPAAVGAVGKGPAKAPQRFNMICAVEHLVGNERMIASDHAPIPAWEEVQYAIDLGAARFQQLEPDYVSSVQPIVEIDRRDIILVRTSEEFVAFRRSDLYLVQVMSGPAHDVRVMGGSCRRMPFTPFRKSGRRG